MNVRSLSPFSLLFSVSVEGLPIPFVWGDSRSRPGVRFRPGRANLGWAWIEVVHLRMKTEMIVPCSERMAALMRRLPGIVIAFRWTVYESDAAMPT